MSAISSARVRILCAMMSERQEKSEILPASVLSVSAVSFPQFISSAARSTAGLLPEQRGQRGPFQGQTPDNPGVFLPEKLHFPEDAARASVREKAANGLLNDRFQDFQGSFQRRRVNNRGGRTGLMSVCQIHPERLPERKSVCLFRADTPTAGTPRLWERARRLTRMPRFSASSIRLTHTRVLGQSSRICRTRFRFLSRQVASQTAMTVFAPPKHRKSRVISSSGE